MQHIRKESRHQSLKRKVSSQNTYVHAFSYLFETDPLFKKRILYCVFWVTLSRRIGDSEKASEKNPPLRKRPRCGASDAIALILSVATEFCICKASVLRKSHLTPFVLSPAIKTTLPPTKR